MVRWTLKKKKKPVVLNIIAGIAAVVCLGNISGRPISGNQPAGGTTPEAVGTNGTSLVTLMRKKDI